MSVEHSVDLMYGIVVLASEMEQITYDLGLGGADLADEEVLESVMDALFSASGLRKGLIGCMDTDDPYSDDPVLWIVYAKSSAIWNDSKRGTGRLFKEKVLAKSDLIIPLAEKKALKQFRKAYGLINKPEMLILGTSN